jgi:DNA primase/energy-coupling factor transporter ATP-binding protein EcfA2
MTIEEIKTRLTLAMLLQHYGLKADKQNRLKCPFHNDKTPSLQLYYKTQTAYCFSTNCSTHGKAIDVIDFILYYEKCTKHEAIKKAESIINPGAVTTQTTAPKQTNEKAMFLERMFTYFKNAVHNSKPAREYIESRNLDHKQIEIGYNAGQFHHGARKDESLINDCLKYGILLDLGLKSRTGETAYKPFGKWCIVFALRNQNHEITGLYFRSTLSDKDQRHFYLRDRSGLYPNYPKAETEKLILTESIIDAASLLQQEEIKSKYEILSLYGTNGLTEEHQTALRKLKHLTEIIFFLNGDEPGNKAVAKYAPMLKAEYPNLKITSVGVPENEDVNSLLQGHSPEILTHLIETRKEVDFILSSEESPKGTEITQLLSDEKEKSEQPKAPVTGLDTNNPYNLKYKGNEAAYQIKGFRTDQPDSLKTTIQTIAEASSITLKLDLYEYKQVESSCKLIAGKLGLRKDAIEADLMQLTSLLEQYRDKQQFKANGRQESKIQVPAATATKCIGFLKAENLIQRINELIGKAGITGEETNRILLFVIASSYKMPDTLHALIQGSSGSGKTRLLKIISYLMPDEDVKRYTRVTDNSFYNQDEYFFVNKLICFEDLDGLKEDAQLAVRELQSNDILRTSTSLKDKNGQITGGERIVRGPIASLACTTRGEIYEDNISRSFLIAVDESKEQTLKIIRYQNEVSAGMIDPQEQKKVSQFIQNCIRLLKPYEVINPYANKITLPESAHKIRRLNELYQSFVKQITLLNQYQRKQDKQGRLITETEDLQTACEILFESIVLKVDELDGSLRQFFERLKSHLKDKEQEFTQRELRQSLNISKAQCSRFFNHLQEMEYITAKYSGNQRKVCYKVDYWDNYSKVRAQIKDDLMNQIAGL